MQHAMVSHLPAKMVMLTIATMIGMTVERHVVQRVNTGLIDTVDIAMTVQKMPSVTEHLK